MSTPTTVTSPLTGEQIERPEPKIKDGEMFLAYDRQVCANIGCCGASALYSGRTIGGARISKVRASDVREWQDYGTEQGVDLGPMRCECGALEARLDDRGRVKIVKVADLPADEQTGAAK